MKKWTTLFLGFSWVVLLQSCRTYQPVFTDEEILSETIHNSYFADPDRDYAYRAGITVYGHEFSGLFILKKTTISSHRIVLTTEFGNTLLDMTLFPEGYQKHSVVPHLDKKIILKTLANDISLLVQENFETHKKGRTESGYIYGSTYRKKNVFLWLTSEKIIKKITLASQFKEKLSVYFEGISDNVAEEILIDHHNMPLQIRLKTL